MSGAMPPPAAPPPASPSAPMMGGRRLTALDLGVIITGLGAILALVGFILGAEGIAQLNGGTASAYQSYLEGFFVVTGIGLFLVVGGWGVHVTWPHMRWHFMAAAPAAAAPMMVAPTASATAAPFCPVCGKPTTYISQYGRYYCYTDQRYV